MEKMMIKKIMRKAFGVLFLLLCPVLPARGADSLLLRIPFGRGAMTTATLPDGTVAELGVVRALPSKTAWPAYTASKWGVPGTVCATAVNAIHILVDVEKGRGRIFSLVPVVTVAPAAPEGAFFSVQSPAGTGLFGGFAPLTGSKVFIETATGREAMTRLPREGETLLI
ncbi:MAG: hypothetical protein LBT65_05660, partial [Synergistaceae bacterium]|nr:hypothetical protein [Synergistaceae bacterium]